MSARSEVVVRDQEGCALTVKAAKPTPCAECPWRTSNWGRTDTAHPEFNTPERRETMWSGRGIPHSVRDGHGMLCHQAAPPSVGGTREGSTVAHECAGATILVQRELLRYRASPSGYDLARGLTGDGLRAWAGHLFGVSPFGLCAAPWSRIAGRLLPDVTGRGIAHHELEPPTDAEAEAWTQSAATEETAA